MNLNNRIVSETLQMVCQEEYIKAIKAQNYELAKTWLEASCDLLINIGA